MATVIGVRNFLRQAAAQTVAASVALVASANLQFNLVAGRIAHARIVIPFILGATGGYRFQIINAQTTAVGGFLLSQQVTDSVTPAFNAANVQTTSAPFANALAVAGNHYYWADLDIIQGAVTGLISLQFACNTAAGSITMLAGASMDLIYL